MDMKLECQLVLRMINIMHYIPIFSLIALGGALGACCRYAIFEIVISSLGNDFPYAALVVNVIGSCLIGSLFAVFNMSTIDSGALRVFWVSGFLGALTTFSTFSMDNVLLFEQGSYVTALLNVIISVTLCFSVCLICFRMISKL